MTEELMTDVRGTSCFVIKFSKADEQIAKEMWEKEGEMVYALQPTLPAKRKPRKVSDRERIDVTWHSR